MAKRFEFMMLLLFHIQTELVILAEGDRFQRPALLPGGTLELQACHLHPINTMRGQKLHLGRKDLVLNGPIDNPNGSYTSCHGFAQVPKVNNPMPVIRKTPPGSNITGPVFESYFANIKAATALSPDYVSVDYSLQLQIGIARAINAGQASLPPDLTADVAGSRGDTARPVRSVTYIEEARRE
jgi:hypothetical protein